MPQLLNKVETVKKVILRGCNNYQELLFLLKEKDAPTKDFESFVTYMVYNFYTNDDFFAILLIIKNNLNEYENYEAENIVFRDILKEIREDYISYI